jgi:predicted NBD/HSP70 family sugar kinase
VSVYGGVETGGSKWECALGTGPDDLRATETVPTTTPRETIDRVVAFFEREGPVDAIGIGSFGPLDGKVASPTWGHITTTPKPGWAHTDVGQEIRRRLSVPVVFDTDVNAAALGEHLWGAAQGLDTFCYITVGTGIGGGGMAGGRLLHGLVHPIRAPARPRRGCRPVRASARTTATAGRARVRSVIEAGLPSAGRGRGGPALEARRTRLSPSSASSSRGRSEAASCGRVRTGR